MEKNEKVQSCFIFLVCMIKRKERKYNPAHSVVIHDRKEKEHIRCVFCSSIHRLQRKKEAEQIHSNFSASFTVIERKKQNQIHSNLSPSFTVIERKKKNTSASMRPPINTNKSNIISQIKPPPDPNQQRHLRERSHSSPSQ
jgi:hypothetical protein